MRQPPPWLQPPEAEFEVVVIGASAGGFPALRTIFAGLPASFRGAIMVAHHRWGGPLTSYRSLLQHGTPLRVVEARQGDRPAPGIIYIAPSGRQLLLDARGTIYTGDPGRYRTVRPSADLLFASVAACHGPRAVAVVLSGYGRDAAEGVRAIRDRGGFVIAQDRASSRVFDMPCSAIETRRVDLVLPLRHIAFALTTLFSQPDQAASDRAASALGTP